MIPPKHKSTNFGLLNDNDLENILWLSISEAAVFGGVQTKTIRRAIQSNIIKYKITNNRYEVDLISVLEYLHSKTKLKNKLDQFGLGQYVEKWRSNK
ncbi:MAG: hypothetical protein Q7T79_02100 [bacterium]|nr:hypothetical protein [bacterium]